MMRKVPTLAVPNSAAADHFINGRWICRFWTKLQRDAIKDIKFPPRQLNIEGGLYVATSSYY